MIGIGIGATILKRIMYVGSKDAVYSGMVRPGMIGESLLRGVLKMGGLGEKLEKYPVLNAIKNFMTKSTEDGVKLTHLNLWDKVETIGNRTRYQLKRTTASKDIIEEAFKDVTGSPEADLLSGRNWSFSNASKVINNEKLSAMASNNIRLEPDDIRTIAKNVQRRARRRMVRGGALTLATGISAAYATRWTMEGVSNATSASAEFLQNIAGYETSRNIPNLMTRQALTERQAALSYIKQSRTNARSLMGREASMVHGGY